MLLADLREVGVLGQEAVAGVDRLGPRDERGRDHRRDVQVRVAGRRRADADRLIGGMDRQAVGVGLAIDDDRLDPELAAGADDPESDLAAVGDEDLIEGQ
ncbi:MAG: hypothetical protein NVSMB8_10650 [Candidatus Limnocylindrales bacterium]